MADVVNDRDVLIMGTTPRYTPPTDRGMFLTPPAAVFKLSADGLTAAPSSFTFTATLLNMTGTVTWSTTGGISLSVNGNTAALTFASFTAVSGTITASITVDGQTFTQVATVTKLADGTIGHDGVRGTINISAATGGVIWSDSDANAAIAAAGYGMHQVRDVVTLYNQAAKFSKTKFWDGTAWQDVAQVLDGNLLVSGSVNAAAMAADSIKARSLAVLGNGAALNRDPYFADFPAAWTGNAGLSAATGPGGAAPANTYVQTNGTNAGTQSELLPVDSSKTYNATISVWSASGNTRGFLVIVNFYDGAGNQIPSTGWGDQYSSGFAQVVTPPADGVWRTYTSGQFGAKASGRPIPATAKSMRIALNLNWTGSGSSTAAMAATGLILQEVSPGVLIEDGAVTAQKLSVAQLSAITASIGTLTNRVNGTGKGMVLTNNGFTIYDDNNIDRISLQVN